ncbi:hypothetical protein FPSE_06749 [Fusarium pseudograminearum CS3096]|uniref:Uncharacterized protein n=1 Tax=Fusarium pseudograminearum (strain CS3096) TaxID=1028729 RepID=K3ULY3_FUSPC|nr:hypothetical protein FPSE_06749 [Fusarium pseudograminearum CS3096]EKJ73136.1 hypothetical protein FPSE_06749 [Fusarium pseudograminearum CS3096]
MDSFSRLPPEIRRNIIVHVESYSAIMKLIRASPTMLWQYTIDRDGIAREILKPILALDDTGTILQDALIIAHSRNYDTDVVTDEELLLSRDRPDPLAQKDRNMTMRLYRVISFAICWIEDYLGKATDPFPSRAYMALPEMATGWTGTRFQDEIVDITPVFFSQLRLSERYRLLRAFLSLEIIFRCYVLFPQRRGLLEWTTGASQIQDPSDTEWDDIMCSTEYFRVLYKTLFNEAAWGKRRRSVRKANAQTAPGSTLPNRLSLDSPTTNTDSLEQGTSLRFPHSICVDTQLRHSDFFPLYIRHETPSFGFSDLSSMLISGAPNFQDTDFIICMGMYFSIIY